MQKYQITGRGLSFLHARVPEATDTLSFGTQVSQGPFFEESRGQ